MANTTTHHKTIEELIKRLAELDHEHVHALDVHTQKELIEALHQACDVASLHHDDHN